MNVKKMLGKLALLAMILLATPAIFAEIPSGYYNGINGLKDRYLKTRLHEIIKNHSTNSYSGLFAQCFKYTDVRDDGTWWDMYSDIQRYVSDGWSGMNREHSLPKSWWGGDENPAYTDLNHLYPSDGPANMKKSNYPLGEVGTATYDNGVTKVGYPIAGQGGGSSRVFEPDDEYKGDFARTYFYMATCYQDFSWKYTYMMLNGEYPSMAQWAIDMLLEWHRTDPVSKKELDRNEEVYRIQHNRNPFIDMPDLVEFIWGDKVGVPYEAGDLPPVGDGTLVLPEHNSTVDFGEVICGKDVTVDVDIRGSLSENLTLKIYGYDALNFSIPTASVSWVDVNSGGYTLKVTFMPKEARDYEAKLLLYDGGLVGITSYVVNLKGKGVDMPVFDRVEAVEASNVSSAGFRANWLHPSNPEVVDYYIVTIKEYENGTLANVYRESTDADDLFYDFTNGKSGADYYYSVQSVRYGEKSPESNEVHVSLIGGVGGIESDNPLVAMNIANGLRFLVAEPHTNVRIVDMVGRVIKVLPSVEKGDCILLPYGAFVLYSDQSARPLKVLVK